MITVILLTGFLGSGKTTLMERLLYRFNDVPVGLIVNEFGEINIDARLLQKDGITMAELSNGSIFCACIKDNFIKALIEMSAREIDYLFVEASGLADPSNMSQILQTVEKHVVRPCHYAGSICVLDGEAFLELSKLLPAITNQLTYAGAIVVNKEDLIPADAKPEIQAAIRQVNQHAPVFFTSYCDVDIKLLIEHTKPPEAAGKDSTNTPDSRPTTYVLKLLPSITINELQGFLNHVAPFTYRIKGFVQIGNNNYSISCVRSHVLLMPWPGQIPASEIVLISAVGIGLTGAIADGIRIHSPSSIKM